MSYEDNFLRKLDRKQETRQELSPSMERAHRKALVTLRNPDYVIQERDFIGVYPEEEVRKDMALATRLRSKFDMDQSRYSQTSKQIADVFEALVLEETELSEWFGNNAHTFKSSDFDDFTGKVDMIAEWDMPEGSRVVGLAVDATYGTDSISKKLEQIKEEIDGGTLGSIKYFKYADGRRGRAPLQNVPRIVLGVSQQIVEELGRLWVDGEKARLGQHPIQRLFLWEMECQLEFMEKYARRTGKETVANAYRDAHETVSAVEKTKRGMDLGALEKDPVFSEIVNRTVKLFGIKEGPTESIKIAA